MDDFMFRFLISNLLLCGIIGVLLLMKRIKKTACPAECSITYGFCYWDF